MSRYSFRLQRLLDLRRKKEQEAAGHVAAARAAATDAERHRDGVTSLRDATRQEMLPAPGQTVRVADLHEVVFRVKALDNQVAGATEATIAAERSVQEKMAALGVAMQHRRVLDRLNERRTEEWRVAEARQERDVMDEIARSRYLDSKKPSTSPD